MTAVTESPKQLPDSLVWLADAPMFIDANQVSRFYDAVVKPDAEKGTTTLEITKETTGKIEAKVGIEADLAPKGVFALIGSIFPSIKASGEISGSGEDKNADTVTIELHSVNTPQRQLVHLSLHYYANHQDRLYFVDDSTQEEWRRADNISKVPRELVFLNLPSQQEAQRFNLPETKIIPTAAEFSNGEKSEIVLLYNELKARDGSDIPAYPEKFPIDQLPEKRREYWSWFDQNFSATQAMIAVEQAASKHGRIRWIDYRVPISKNGDTLHLHVCPSGEYDTGVLAYNFIKRGYKHGLRLVGTLKSEPDMNVLAIYDK